MMYTRRATLPEHSFFLLGPRGTGKTSWLRENLPDALWFNLLLNRDYLPLLSDTGIFRQAVLASSQKWVVIDEVQKIPALLNEVHDLISLHGKKYRFALSGSSARKLRRLDINLLAGRALDRRFFPLVSCELGASFNLSRALQFGTLPGIYDEAALAPELLESYVSTYLKEEIQQEALVKDLDSFARFLKVSGIMNGCVVEISNMARECAVNRKTVERYFDTLVDTLIAFRLPAFQAHLKVKERSRPKFYLFDVGVARALAQRTRLPIADAELGILLETYMIHELRAAQMYLNTGGQLSYYGAERSEIDVILSIANHHTGIEIKTSKIWRPEYGRTIEQLLQVKKLHRGIGIYMGDRRLQVGSLTVYPVGEFLSALWSGDFSREACGT